MGQSMDFPTVKCFFSCSQCLEEHDEALCGIAKGAGRTIFDHMMTGDVRQSKRLPFAVQSPSLRRSARTMMKAIVLPVGGSHFAEGS